MNPIDLDAELASLALQSRAQLRVRWTRLTGKPAPKVSAALMRHALSYALQASVYGGLSERTRQRLERLGEQKHHSSGPSRQRLVREWKGVLHIVMIDADGTITSEGKTWRSLSEVARAITGTRWSGPAFFGLKDRRKSA